MATVGCPECGAEVRFTTPGSVLSVCTFCHSVVARRGLDYTKLGKVAQLAEIPSPLHIGLRGRAHGGFQIVGRVQYDHGAGAWNEWYLALDSGRWLWLAETQGRYYLSMPLGIVSDAPRFEDMRIGRTVRLTLPDGEKTLRATEIHTAKLVSAEGELPFEVVPDEPLRYVDLSGPKGSFGTLDYGAPGAGAEPAEVQGYFGQQVRPDTLQIDKASFEPPPPRPAKAGKRMTCPKCSGALELRAPDASMRVTCPYCRSLVDVSSEPLKALATLKAPDEELLPIFELGAKGTLLGREYTVLGRIRRVITKGGPGEWDEYLLWTGEPSDSAFHYLIVSGGHFTLAEPINYGDVSGSNLKMYTHQGKQLMLRQVERCTTKVSYISGEFPWAIEVGEAVEVDDSATSGFLLSIEKSLGQHQELNATLGTYLDSAEVFRAFKIDRKPPRKEYVAPHQPNPHSERWLRQKGVLFWATLTMVGLLGWSCGRSGHYTQTIPLRTLPGVEPAAEHVSISEPFDLGKKGQQFAVQARLRAEVENSWVATDISLINEDSGQVYSVSLEAAYYHGVDDGESWSEGSRAVDQVVPEVPGGRYVVRVEPSWPVNQSCSYNVDCGILGTCFSGKCTRSCYSPTAATNQALATSGLSMRVSGLGSCQTGQECVAGQCVLSAVPMKLTISCPTTRYSYAFLLWLLMAIVPAWTWFRMRQFEQQRTEDNS